MKKILFSITYGAKVHFVGIQPAISSVIDPDMFLTDNEAVLSCSV